MLRSNKCSKHPSEQKDRYCSLCNKTNNILCSICAEIDKNHANQQKLFPESLKENFEILRFLGKGCSDVYEARSLNDGQTYALKVIEKVDDETFDLLNQESILHATLSHPNIIKYKSSFRLKKESLFIIWMEIADSSLTSQMPNLNLTENLLYFKQICQGLDYLHKKNIMHSDLKPLNILIKNGLAKLCDLGMAKIIDKSNKDEDSYYGTIPYYPPELWNNQSIDEKSDVWATGIIFHQMLTKGIHPFNPENQKISEVNFEKKVLKNEISISKEIKDPVCLKILKGCLEPNPKKRLSMEEVLNIIDTTFTKITLPNGDIYEGELKNGQKNGKGKMNFANGETYEGGWKNDKMEGRGIFQYRNGIYEGDYLNDKKEGHGKFSFSDGAYYEGQWSNDVQSRKGFFKHKDGNTYEGEYQDGKRHGFGILKEINKGTYKGEFKNDSICGKGVYSYVDGSVYEGEWENNKKNGKGKLNFKEGGYYDGEWKNDREEGRGRYCWKDGSKYSGEIRQGRKDGVGTIEWPDGGSYEGEWREDKIEGKGKFKYSDGAWYEGMLKGGERHGYGRLHHRGGNIQDGQWENGQIKPDIRNPLGALGMKFW